MSLAIPSMLSISQSWQDMIAMALPGGEYLDHLGRLTPSPQQQHSLVVGPSHELKSSVAFDSSGRQSPPQSLVAIVSIGKSSAELTS